MKKTINVTWKIILILMIIFMLIGAGALYTKRDKLVTSNISMKYFSEMVNNFDEEGVKTFVANSNNDILYTNFVSTMNNNYLYEGVSDFSFKITNKELFGNGKYQCYLSNSFENYVPKCDLENEVRYMNYLIEMNVSYKLNGEVVNQKEKGLVVFVKDMGNGNYFTWKLVRFDRYKIAE